MNSVQSFITNISFPTSLDELYDYAHLFDVEKILGLDYFNLIDKKGVFHMDNPKIYESRKTSWTAPKWCKKGDIVFFMHSKTANATISRLKTELLQYQNQMESDCFWTLMNALFRAKKLHDTYGGKIFAIGEVCGELHYYQDDDAHYKSTVFASMDKIFLLEKPIDISEFNSKITVSRQGSITPVSGENFDFLKQVIQHKNKIVEEYFQEAVATLVPLYNLTDENWLPVLNQYRRSFFLEEQFRTYYVNRFLKYFGDNKTFYRECTCIKQGNAKKFVDNVIKFQGKYLLVEVKLSVSAEQNIIGQLANYSCIDELWLDKNRKILDGYFRNNILAIDTDHIYIYNNFQHEIKPIYNLDDIKTCEDIIKLREVIAGYLE